MLIKCKRVLVVGLSLSLLIGGALLAAPSRAFADTQSELAAAAEQLESLGSQLTDLQDQLAVATSDLQELDAAADAKSEEVVEAQEELDVRRAALSDSVRDSYKGGSFSLIDFLLTSSSFEDLVSRAYYVEKILGAQADKISLVEDAADRLAQEQSELEARQTEQQATVDELMTLVGQYQSTVDEASSVYNALDARAKAELAAQQGENESIAAAVEAAESASMDAEQLQEEDANREDTKDSDSSN